jgi:hypothetical protein
MSVTNSKPAIQQRPAVQQTMGFTPRRDPIPRADKDLLGRDPTKIEHNGGIDSQEAFCIVHKYETEGEKQKRENTEEYGFNGTNVQLAIVTGCNFHEIYNDDDWYYEPLYEQETYDFYGTYSDEYIQMVEAGEVIHGEASCIFPKSGTGASIDGEALSADAQSDEPTTPEQQASLDANTTEPQGELTTAFSAAADPDPVVQPAPAIAANNPTYQAPAMSA